MTRPTLNEEPRDPRAKHSSRWDQLSDRARRSAQDMLVQAGVPFQRRWLKERFPSDPRKPGATRCAS